LITSHGRIKFTAFAVSQSFIFLQGKSFANFTRSRPQVSRLRFGTLCQSRFGVFLCELDAQTASVLSPQTQKLA